MKEEEHVERVEQQVVHDREGERFFLEIEGEKAYVMYRMTDTGAVDLWRTFVPSSLGGRGIAARLVEAALRFAEEERLEVIPSCSYVEHFLAKRVRSSEEGADE